MTGEFIVAVHSIVFLNHNGKSMTSDEIANNVCTNSARIRKVMAKLKKANLVKTKEGAKNGGYIFDLCAKNVTLLEIFNAVDERIVSAPWKSGNQDMECLIASGMASVMGSIIDTMDGKSKQVLNSITVDDINKMIFSE